MVVCLPVKKTATKKTESQALARAYDIDRYADLTLPDAWMITDWFVTFARKMAITRPENDFASLTVNRECPMNAAPFAPSLLRTRRAGQSINPIDVPLNVISVRRAIDRFTKMK